MSCPGGSFDNDEAFTAELLFDLARTQHVYNPY